MKLWITAVAVNERLFEVNSHNHQRIINVSTLLRYLTVAMAMTHVLVGGGTGFIGSALVSALRSEAAAVTTITRNIIKPNQITWEDIKKHGIPKDITAVINVAGQNILDPLKRWNDEFKDQVWNSRIKTNQILVRAINNSDVKAFSTISGVAYYKPDGSEYTEEDKCEPYDYLSELCHKWEKASELSGESKCRRVTIRSGVVLGRTGGMIQQAFIPFFLGLGGPMGSGNQPMPWIHISDLVKLFIFSLEEEKVRGILNGVAPQIITNKEFTQAFAKALTRPALLPMPEFVLNAIFSRERAKIILEGQKVVPKRVLEHGFEYDYPSIKEACEQFAVLVYNQRPY